MPENLEDIPNIGPKMAQCLRGIGITKLEELKNKDPLELYKKLGRKNGGRPDPCVLDVFISAVAFVNGAPPRPWWHYTAERRRMMKQRT